MINNLLNRKVKVGVYATNIIDSHYSKESITGFYEGVVTEISNEFIVLNNSLFISIKFIQTIQVI